MVSGSRFLPVLFLILAACAQPEENRLCCAAPEPPAIQDSVASLWTADTRTILTGDAARSLAHQCSRVSPGPVSEIWTPADVDIDALEDALIHRLASELEQRGENPSPGDYYRQYAGYVIGGKRVIYVNGVQQQALALSSNADFDWRTQPVQICDGGSITFGVEYDPATGELSKFAFNGQI